MTDTAHIEDRCDWLYGTAAIAKHLNIPLRAAEHLIETKRIPFFKQGRKVVTTPAALKAYADGLLRACEISCETDE